MKYLVLSALLCLQFTWPTFAQGAAGEQRSGDLYRIEMVVFAWDEVDNISGERWILPKSLRYPARLAQLQRPDIQAPAESTPALPPAAPVEPFTPLPAEQRKLNSAVNRISRQMRVLMHEAWLQPLYSRERADSLLITGGDPVGEHFELEGYVTFSVERYLHLEANLWLSRFSLREAGDDSWPLLPPLPFRTPASQDPWMSSGAGFQQLLSDPYRTDQIFTLQEKRRMRSGEVHYLDHPRFGLIVRIDPAADSETRNTGSDQ